MQYGELPTPLYKGSSSNEVRDNGKACTCEDKRLSGNTVALGDCQGYELCLQLSLVPALIRLAYSSSQAVTKVTNCQNRLKQNFWFCVLKVDIFLLMHLGGRVPMAAIYSEMHQTT